MKELKFEQVTGTATNLIPTGTYIDGRQLYTVDKEGTIIGCIRLTETEANEIELDN